MSASPSDFRRTNVKRALLAVQSAGLRVARVELDGGKITIIPANGASVEITDNSNNSFDKVMRK
jgi:hypothetical protein